VSGRTLVGKRCIRGGRYWGEFGRSRYESRAGQVAERAGRQNGIAIDEVGPRTERTDNTNREGHTAAVLRRAQPAKAAERPFVAVGL
jgi:hypothetical protein